MPRSSETPPSGRALLVTGLRRCDGITRGCPYQTTSQHHGKEQQTSIEAPAARHSGAGRIQKPRPTSQHPPKPAPASEAPPNLHWCTGLRRYDGLERMCFIRRPCCPTTVDHQHRPASPIQPSFRRRPESRTRRLSQHAPRLAANAWRPINRRTGYRPAPVRRSRTRALFRRQSHPQARRTANAPQARNTRHSGAGRNPETTLAAASTMRPDRHPASEAPSTPHWVPACAGTTVSNDGAFPDANRTHR